jgi:hypothetical protein
VVRAQKPFHPAVKHEEMRMNLKISVENARACIIKPCWAADKPQMFKLWV